MGVKLFDRDKHSVRLTPAGEAFLDDAVEILRRSEDALQKARKAEVGEVG